MADTHDAPPSVNDDSADTPLDDEAISLEAVSGGAWINRRDRQQFLPRDA